MLARCLINGSCALSRAKRIATGRTGTAETREARHEETWGKHEKALGDLGLWTSGGDAVRPPGVAAPGGAPAERMGGRRGWWASSRDLPPIRPGKTPEKGEETQHRPRRAPAHASAPTLPLLAGLGLTSCLPAALPLRERGRGDAAEHARQSLNAATVCASFLPGSWIAGSRR